MPSYARLQEELTLASGPALGACSSWGPARGRPRAGCSKRIPDAFLVGVDASAEMLAVARSLLPADASTCGSAAIEEPLPEGPFDLVASALCVHHLNGPEKADLFGRVFAALRPGGRFVLADVVVPVDPADATTPLTPGFDRPSPLADQVAWLLDAGFEVRVCWASGDLAVVAADAPADPAAPARFMPRRLLSSRQ